MQEKLLRRLAVVIAPILADDDFHQGFGGGRIKMKLLRVRLIPWAKRPSENDALPG